MPLSMKSNVAVDHGMKAAGDPNVLAGQIDP